jgi:hypothetical protein
LIFGSSLSQLDHDRQAVSDEIWNDHAIGLFKRSEIPSVLSGRAASLSGCKGTTLRKLLHQYLATPAPDDMLKVYGKCKGTELGKLVQSMPMCNHDILIHLQSILMYPCPEEEVFDDFPYFGDRIRSMAIILEERKPRNLRQMWRDTKDSTQWWTFWLVLLVGVPSLLLALGSLAVSTAQTWASFKALNMPS